MKHVAVFILSLLAIIIGVCYCYTCKCDSADVCTTIPSDSLYYLTSFCDQETYCGTSCGNCSWPYSTSNLRFGCNANLKCCDASNTTKCITLLVIDAGPACWVEEDAGMPIIDASYSTCKFFTGGISCGYQDEILIKCNVVSTVGEDHIGPCYDGKADENSEWPKCPQ